SDQRPSSVSPYLFNDPPATAIYTLSLHDALPISWDEWRGRESAVGPVSPPPGREALVGPGRPVRGSGSRCPGEVRGAARSAGARSEEHTSELQSRENLVCRLLLEKENRKQEPSSP